MKFRVPPDNQFLLQGDFFVVLLLSLQITGNYKSVQNAIFQVTSRLRDNLLPREVLNENRVSNCYGEVTETGPSQVLQPTSSILDNDHGPNLAQRLHTGRSENTSGPQPVKLQPQEVKALPLLASKFGWVYLQAAGNGNMVAIQGVHHSSTTSAGSFDLETSLDSLLSCDMLNEVGGPSPYNGGSETTFSGLLQSLDVSPASDQESALTRAMGNIELFDGVDCPTKSQLLETVERHELANGDDKGCLELESGKKFNFVKNTSVEIVVHEDAFDSIYGKNGCNLARLKEISGAKVEVHEPCGGESEGRVLISGTPDQTLIARSLLQAFIQANQNA
ncbi:KH domain-containing protein [Gossypium australe]|uniref:KH domain-containing protein n=1 Tax=Gossypium australe TaxID=47621 RepID=A0A5B6UXZ2_9ROSI|nr:KH domain-containing protein [Gossypium australe]